MRRYDYYDIVEERVKNRGAKKGGLTVSLIETNNLWRKIERGRRGGEVLSMIVA